MVNSTKGKYWPPSSNLNGHTLVIQRNNHYKIIIIITSNNHRLQSAGNNEALLLHRGGLREFHATDSQNTRDQSMDEW